MVTAVVFRATTTIRRRLLSSTCLVIYDSEWVTVLGGDCICVGFGRSACVIMAFYMERTSGEKMGFVMTLSSRMGQMPRLYFNRSAMKMYEKYLAAQRFKLREVAF